MLLNFFKKRKVWEIIVLSSIIILAFGIRFWNFDDWLYFEADQSRDANIVKMALEKGPGYLPLLGPRAAGTFLRLGPAEYYFQYLSALIFDSAEPFVLAYPALFFSVLSILVFYFFLKNFFSQGIALAVTAIYAFSFILIQYARFAWNPNGIPFWGLLFMFSIYKTSTKENRWQAGIWLLLASLSYGVVSQLHFLALVGFPIIAVLFWIFYFPKKIKFYFWFSAVALLALIYTPMFFSELSTGGDNLKQFKYALTAKTGGGEKKLSEKIKDDLRQTAIAFSMFTTSFGHKDSRIAFYFGAVLMFLGFFYAGYLARKNQKKRVLFWLLATWLGVFLLLYFKTDTSLKPRFFFPITAIPFFLLAFGFEFLVIFNKRKKAGYFLLVFLTFFFIWANLDAVNQWYDFLKTADNKSINRKMSLKQDSGITLKGLIAVVDYMAEEAQKNGKNVCYDGIQEYKRTVEYLLEIRYPEIKRARISNGMKEEDKRVCQFFSFAQKKTEMAKVSSKHDQYFQSQLVFEGGNLVVWALFAKEEFFLGQELPIKIEENILEIENEELSSQVDSDSETDEELLGEEDLIIPSIIPENSEKSSEPVPRPRRVERVYWKDVEWF